MQAVDVAGNLERVRARIDAAARRSGRDPGEVVLVAVSKTKPAALIDAAIAAGARIVGENYVQEARDKRPQVCGVAEWHFIGHLQRNKARAAVDLFDVIETLESLELAAALDRLGRERERDVRVLIEVNSGGEASKRGVAPAALPAFVESLGRFERVRVEGLMTIPPPAEGDAARTPFRLLRRLRDELRGGTPANVDLRELSMGMTGDFEIAIEEGATLVRVGTAIFGTRS